MKQFKVLPFGRNGNTITFNFKNNKAVSVHLLPVKEEGVIWDSLGKNVPQRDLLSELQSIFQTSSGKIEVTIINMKTMEILTDDFTAYEHLCSADELAELLFRVSKS